MKIHFCDLCNESVPQSDLDDGRAFLRKGRVICAVCDRTMSHDVLPGGPFDGGPAAAAAAAAASAGARLGARPDPNAGKPPVPGAPGAAAPAGTAHGIPNQPAAPSQPVAHAHHAPRQRGGGGAGLAVMSLLFTGGLAFWASGKIATLESGLVGGTARLEDSQYDTRKTLEQQLDRQSETLAELGDGVRSEVREMREWLNAELAEAQLQGRQVSDRLTEFGQRIETMSESFGNVNRHDQELFMLQQRYTALADELAEVAKAIAGGAIAGAAAPAAQAQAEPEVEAEAAPPPWMGLVEQLASPNTSERWQAVVALGDTHDSAVSEFLVPALADEDIFIRMVTARVLGDLGSTVGIPALIDALDDDESAVREAAYIALKTVTKRDLRFDPVTEDASDRARQIKAWRDWWEKEEKGRRAEG